MPPHSRRHLATLLLALSLVQRVSAEQAQSPPPVPAAPSPNSSGETQSLNELRNTVINLLQGLVERGVLTKDQAQAMVKAAQQKAATDAAAAAQQEQAETGAGAVRVPYVPQVVKEEISKEVAAEVTPEVTKQVVQQARTERWGVPAALPDWVQRLTFSGDMRVRGEADTFASDNVKNTYLNFNAVNAAGGIAKAGQSAFINTTVNKYYLVGRLRVGMDAELSDGWGIGARLSTGTLVNPDSTNQILGQYGGRYQTNIDLAYLSWAGDSPSGWQQFSFWGGKFPNPFLTTDIVWDTDVTLEGVAFGYRLDFAQGADAPQLVATLGAIPEQYIALASNNKWLYAGQLGMDLHPSEASRIRFGVAYYFYDHIHGIRNALNDNTYDYTAPLYVQKGNTLFDIRNDTDPTTNLFALAADYHLLDGVVAADWLPSPGYRISLTADWVRNVGFNESAVTARVGAPVAPRITAWQTEASFGSDELDHPWAWRTFVAYKFIQRDAVLDAFNDQDFHLGGTDAKGFLIGGDVSFTPYIWARLRYISANAIDGPPLGIDVWQLDLNGRF
jgi:hypothetical protein